MPGEALPGALPVSAGTMPRSRHVRREIRSVRARRARYPIVLTVQYALNGRTCFGVTTNISSSGMFIATREVLAVNKPLKVTVDWPAVLEGRCPLCLVILGKVRRSGTYGMGVEIERYEFRLRRSPER